MNDPRDVLFLEIFFCACNDEAYKATKIKEPVSLSRGTHMPRRLITAEKYPPVHSLGLEASASTKCHDWAINHISKIIPAAEIWPER